MSKLTNPDTEASVSCGFYNGENRYYDALQFSSIFDGIVRDGIFLSIGDCFHVTADGESENVYVGTGKCWFNHTWTENNAVLPVQCPSAHSFSDTHRIDAIVIEIDSRESVSDNFIKVVEGEPSAEPQRPVMKRSEGVYQYALCYIYRAGGSTKIAQADITDVRGMDETPFLSGILETLDAEQLFVQWYAELNDFIKAEEETSTKFRQTQETRYLMWRAEMEQLMDDFIEESRAWYTGEQNYFTDWFNQIKGQLSSSAEGNLQLQINEDEVERILLNGFVSGVKTFSDDNSEITHVEGGENPRTLIKTFSPDGNTITTVLLHSTGAEIGRLVKTFSSDGSTLISSEVTII